MCSQDLVRSVLHGTVHISQKIYLGGIRAHGNALEPSVHHLAAKGANLLLAVTIPTAAAAVCGNSSIGHFITDNVLGVLYR
jgi:hypothetical protein